MSRSGHLEVSSGGVLFWGARTCASDPGAGPVVAGTPAAAFLAAFLAAFGSTVMLCVGKGEGGEEGKAPRRLGKSVSEGGRAFL